MSRPAPTAIVVVSHSATLAKGVVEVAEQMAPTAIIRLRFSSLVVAIAKCTVKLR